jgi:hypothetical protein
VLQSSELSIAQVIPFVRTWVIVASLKHVEQHLWHLFRNGFAPPSVLHRAQNALVELPPEDTALNTALLASVSQSAPLASVMPQTIVDASKSTSLGTALAAPVFMTQFSQHA